VLGLTEDGGMAAECQVPEAALVSLPAGLDVADALLVEPVAVAVHGLRRAHTSSAHRLVVIGGGTIGLAAAAVALDGGAEVAVCARHPHQLDAAERLGARAVAPGEHPPFPADLVVEAAGTQSALDQAVGLAPLGGEVVLVSTYWEPVALGVLASMREVTLTPAMMYGHHDGTRDVDVAAGVLARRPEVARTLITHRFPLEDASRAFEVAADRASGASKVVLVP
jgi:2-desacetyl-2-hydroxyethyl bacteriochlorophyllide A dehydrogenase